MHSGLGSDDEVRLVATLFNSHGYNPLIRPVENLSEIVTIKFGLAMVQLINVVCCSFREPLRDRACFTKESIYTYYVVEYIISLILPDCPQCFIHP